MTWKNAPDGKILKKDVSIAKNYLLENEISELNRVVTMYLDYAENQAKKQQKILMTEWIDKLEAFLKFNDYEILEGAGKVSAEVAKELAEEQYDKFRIVQDQEYLSDFDKEIAKLKEKE